jgi:acetylornithine deacetylase
MVNGEWLMLSWLNQQTAHELGADLLSSCALRAPAGSAFLAFVLPAAIISPSHTITDFLANDFMNVFQLTRELIEIESVSWNEGAVGRYLRDYLSDAGFAVMTQEVTEGRFNVYAKVGDTLVTLSTHMDTVPPFISSREDEVNIYGRGACDAKGLIAAEIFAAKKLVAEGLTDLGLLFVVGEEDGSDGARVANSIPNRNKFLINGEPTESTQALASKGALRVMIEAHGRTAHSAYPELGESAIEKLLDILQDVRQYAWPVDEKLGPTTCNIGTLQGGRKPNVVPDHAASELMFRTVVEADEMFHLVERVVAGRATVKRGFSLPPLHLNTVEAMAHIPTSVVRFGTDIPCLTNWGHTSHEFIIKQDLLNAVDTYAQLARTLLAAAA